MEELVAELDAAFLCAELGITVEPRPDHAQYPTHGLKLGTPSRAAPGLDGSNADTVAGKTSAPALSDSAP